jgi:hypothetical protein
MKRLILVKEKILECQSYEFLDKISPPSVSDFSFADIYSKIYEMSVFYVELYIVRKIKIGNEKTVIYGEKRKSMKALQLLHAFLLCKTLNLTPL